MEANPFMLSHVVHTDNTEDTKLNIKILIDVSITGIR